MYGYEVACDVTREESELLGEPLYYDKDTQLAWYKPRSSG
jgi:hypothetical protein